MSNLIYFPYKPGAAVLPDGLARRRFCFFFFLHTGARVFLPWLAQIEVEMESEAKPKNVRNPPM